MKLCLSHITQQGIPSYLQMGPTWYGWGIQIRKEDDRWKGKGEKVEDSANSGPPIPAARQQGLDLPERTIDLMLLTRHLLRLLSSSITDGGAQSSNTAGRLSCL